MSDHETLLPTEVLAEYALTKRAVREASLALLDRYRLLYGQYFFRDFSMDSWGPRPKGYHCQTVALRGVRGNSIVYAESGPRGDWLDYDRRGRLILPIDYLVSESWEDEVNAQISGEAAKAKSWISAQMRGRDTMWKKYYSDQLARIRD